MVYLVFRICGIFHCLEKLFHIRLKWKQVYQYLSALMLIQMVWIDDRLFD